MAELARFRNLTCMSPKHFNITSILIYQEENIPIS